MANTVRKQATKPVDLIALAGDASGAWETQVFCGTVVSTSRDGTFISFGAQKDGLLRNKWSYQGVHRQTGKPQEIELRVNAKIRVMITNIKLAKKLRDTRVGLRVAPQCRCCRAFGHYESACKARKDRVFGRKAAPAIVCQPAMPCIERPNYSQLLVAVVGDELNLAVPSATKPVTATPSEYPKMTRLFAAAKPVVATPVVLDYGALVRKNEPAQVQAKQVVKEQVVVKEQQIAQQAKISKSARRRARDKRTKALKRAEATPVAALAGKENLPSQQGNKFGSAESRLDTMVSELDLLLGL